MLGHSIHNCMAEISKSQLGSLSENYCETETGTHSLKSAKVRLKCLILCLV